MIKLKPCPFCGGKAILRSPKKLRTNHSAILSDVSCSKCLTTNPGYWPWDEHEELPRKEQDKLAVEAWNRRKK